MIETFILNSVDLTIEFNQKGERIVTLYNI